MEFLRTAVVEKLKNYKTGVADWTPDDVCSMVMYDNGTTDIHDDIIINAKYSSFTMEK